MIYTLLEKAVNLLATRWEHNQTALCIIQVYTYINYNLKRAMLQNTSGCIRTENKHFIRNPEKYMKHFRW